MFDGGVHHRESVLPADLLALGVGSSVVGDTHFIHFEFVYGEQSDNFRIKTKSLRNQNGSKFVPYLSSESFVA
jgi:hypothetical protein